MKALNTRLFGFVLVGAVLSTCASAYSGALVVGGNTATNGYDPMAVGSTYKEVQDSLKADFPGTTFTSLSALNVNLSAFDLLILNRFSSSDLTSAEQTSIYNYVAQGGNILYVGEANGGVSNTSFTQVFGEAMTPDSSTDVAIAFATYTNTSHPFLSGSFGAPSDPPSGSFAAKVSTLGSAVELAKWDGGGVAIAALNPNVLAPGSGFVLFLTDTNMITQTRFMSEVGPLLSNALSVPEPSGLVVLTSLAIGCLGRRRWVR